MRHIDVSPKRLKDMYLKEEKTLAEIADDLGVSQGVVRSRLVSSGVTLRRPRKRLKYEVTKSVLARMYLKERKTVEEIGGELGIPNYIIQHRLVRFGIPRRKSRLDHIKSETLARMYVKEKKSTLEIATKLGISDATVRNKLLEYGAPIKRHRTSTFNPKKQTLEKMYFGKEMSMMEIAIELGVPYGTIQRKFYEFNIPRRGLSRIPGKSARLKKRGAR